MTTFYHWRCNVCCS